jgi:hypothetical protein
MRGNWILSFFGHSLLATAGVLLGGSLLAFLIALPVGYLSSGVGNIVDRAVDTWIMRYLADEPFFIFQVLTAACVGFFTYRFSKSRAPAWVWLIPAAILVVNVVPRLLGSSPGSGSKWVFDNYFGHGCGGSECLYELFVTAPFYTSIAYAVGYWVRKRALRSQTVSGSLVSHQT